MVKICGLTTPVGVRAAVDAGADAIGFVCTESPRQVTPKRARELCAAVPPLIIRVAVMRHPQATVWQAVAKEFGPDWLQTDAADFDGLVIPEEISRLRVYRDTQSFDPASLAPDEPILFEAGESGQGMQANWQRAAALSPVRKLILAGGLTPDNVGEAIATVRPYGVDVSSGVESRRGVKDSGLIAAFIYAVRAAEQGHAH